MEAYPLKFRELVIEKSNAGMGTKAIAKLLSVSETFVRKMRRQFRELGHLEPRKTQPNHATKLDEYVPLLDRILCETPDITLREICEILPIKVSQSTVARMLKRMKVTYKKKS